MNIEKIRKCTACELSKTRINVVVGSGSGKSGILVLGEAPGKDEDLVGLPFIGKSGHVLDKVFGKLCINKRDLCITNTVLCRPIAPDGAGKENVAPTVEQQDACKHNVREIIETIKPKLIIALGKTAIGYILRRDDFKVGEYAGKIISLQLVDGTMIDVYCTYHPSAVLRGNKIAYVSIFDTFYRAIKEVGYGENQG